MKNIEKNISDSSEKLVLPTCPIYTEEFDRVCSAQELYKEGGKDISRKHIATNSSKESEEKLLLMAQGYKTESLTLYGYVPPIVFITDNSGSLRGNPAAYLEGLLISIISIG